MTPPYSRANGSVATSLEHFRRVFVEHRPDVDPAPALGALRRFAEWRGDAPGPGLAPDRMEISGYLRALSARVGERSASAELAQMQIGASALWGAPIAGMIGSVLRQNRCPPKMPAKTSEERARMAISALPEEWQRGLTKKLSSETGRRTGEWSAQHTQAVAYAMARWSRWCIASGNSTRPSGRSFQAYARDLRDDGLADRSVSDYLSRITSGFSTSVDPSFRSVGCEHVISRHHALGKVAGRRTKTGDQLVGASAIFELGLELVDEARRRGPRGLHVARDFRNGLLLAVAAALPQRARALSHLSFGTSLHLLEEPYIQIALPGRVLKMRESRKPFTRFDKILENAPLWSALGDYRREFRPLFDDGTALFPSIIDLGAAITSAQLGRLVGDLTCKHLGVRVSIHRVRDNVATEASEELKSGGYLAAPLLGHRSAATTMRSYDHAQGVRAAKEYGDLLSARRSSPTTLRL